MTNITIMMFMTIMIITIINNHYNSNYSNYKNCNNYNLREVGVPSRNILHGRGVGSKSRNRVTRVVGSLGAFDPQNTYRNFSLESFFLGAGMRDVYRNFVFRGSTS